MLDCVDVAFLPGEILDELSLPLPPGRHPRRWDRPQQDPHARCVRRSGSAGCLTEEIHRGRAHSEGSLDDRPERLQHPADRLRPPQAPREKTCREAGKLPPLPPPPGGRTLHHGAQRPSRPGCQPPSLPRFAAHDKAESPPPGHASIATTSPSASPCKTCSATSAPQLRSPRPHRQLFVRHAS